MKPFIGVSRSAAPNDDSLDAQEARIRSYARNKGYSLSVVHKFCEGAAGGSARPIWNSILDDVKENASKIEGVILCSPDRASRSLGDLVHLWTLSRENGIRIVFADLDTSTGTSSKEFQLSFQATYVAHFRSESTRRGMERRVRSGLFVGRAPYGYDNIKINGHSHVQVNPIQARVLSEAFTLVAEGTCKLSRLGEALDSRALRRSEAPPGLTLRRLRTILRNRAYVGEVSYRGQWLPGVQERIVSDEMFDLVQARLGESIVGVHAASIGGTQ